MDVTPSKISKSFLDDPVVDIEIHLYKKSTKLIW